MAKSLADSYGWFTPADLTKVILAFHKTENAESVVLVGGQALVAWVIAYGIELPSFDGPFLTQDADFLGTGKQASQIAKSIGGKAKIAGFDDIGPNVAIVEFTGEKGEKLLIDFLEALIGIRPDEARRQAVRMQVDENPPIAILHPLLVLKSRFENLLHLSEKRNSNGVTQAKVAIKVAEHYMRDCMKDPDRRREGLRAAQFIGELAESRAGIFVWKHYDIDVLKVVDETMMPREFPRSWKPQQARVHRKRDIANRVGLPKKVVLLSHKGP